MHSRCNSRGVSYVTQEICSANKKKPTCFFFQARPFIDSALQVSFSLFFNACPCFSPFSFSLFIDVAPKTRLILPLIIRFFVLLLLWFASCFTAETYLSPFRDDCTTTNAPIFHALTCAIKYQGPKDYHLT